MKQLICALLFFGSFFNVFSSQEKKWTTETYLAHRVAKAEEAFWAVIRAHCTSENHCEKLEEDIRQDLEKQKKLLSQEPQVPALHNPHLPPSIYAEIKKILQLKNINPYNILITKQDLGERIGGLTAKSKTSNFMLVLNERFLPLSSDSEHIKNIKMIMMKDTIFYESSHMEALSNLKTVWIQQAALLSQEHKDKNVGNQENIKFNQIDELNADLVTSLQNSDIAQEIYDIKCQFVQQVPYKKGDTKFDIDKIHPAPAYTCYKLKKILAMLAKDGRKI
ncbi:MAG TPA: hypothetical protein VEK38_03180 [Candidatus Bathyarchaeia archaeon]|nr:hypothetical protein [Candidatus Bathyarchaeia archaeon]